MIDHNLDHVSFLRSDSLSLVSDSLSLVFYLDLYRLQNPPALPLYGLTQPQFSHEPRPCVHDVEDSPAQQVSLSELQDLYLGQSHRGIVGPDHCTQNSEIKAYFCFFSPVG